MTNQPPSDAGQLELAYQQFTKLLGEQAVITQEALVQEFRDPFEGPEAEHFQPAFVVQPADVEELRGVLRIAAEHGVRLWTSSMGRNFGYGGSAPLVSGSVVVSLRRLNRILDVNEELGFALVEPGVTFFDLHEELRRRGSALAMSVPDLGWGSIVGNALEHGYGYHEFGDHASAVCGMEVVLADGEVLRTGQGANTRSEIWNAHKRGFGPSLDSLFMQSNFGIVSKMGIWLRPRPEVIVTGSIICEGESDILPLIELLRPLIQDGTIQGYPLLGATREPNDFAGERGAQLARSLRKVMRPGRWNARISLYGPATVVAAKKAIIEAKVKGLPGAKLELRTYRGDADPETIEPRDLVPAGVPTMSLLNMIKGAFYGDNTGHIDFSPVIPFDASSAAQHEQLVADVLKEYELAGMFAWIVNPRSLVGACMILFDSSSAEEVQKAHAAVAELCERAAALGWVEYRAHLALVDDVAKNFDFGDFALSRTYSKIKDALDPSGILSPGNHGIWPSEGANRSA